MSEQQTVDLAPPAPVMAAIVAAELPPAYAKQFSAGKLVPTALMFEQNGEHGVVAGRPITLPVRPLRAEEVVNVLQRYMAAGQIAIGVTVVPPANRPKVV